MILPSFSNTKKSLIYRCYQNVQENTIKIIIEYYSFDFQPQ